MTDICAQTDEVNLPALGPADVILDAAGNPCALAATQPFGRENWDETTMYISQSRRKTCIGRKEMIDTL